MYCHLLSILRISSTAVLLLDIALATLPCTDRLARRRAACERVSEWVTHLPTHSLTLSQAARLLANLSVQWQSELSAICSLQQYSANVELILRMS